MAAYDIVGIGASLYDTLMVVPRFPEEDTKLLASRTMGQGGGPCATALAAAARLGRETAYLGIMGDDAAGTYMMRDLRKHGVYTGHIQVRHGYLSHMSFILLNEATGSRTCVWSRGDVPVMELSEEDLALIRAAKVLHVDGNHLDAAVMGAAEAKKAGVLVSMDAGGNYDGIERLLPYVDILIPSEEFVLRFTGASEIERGVEELYHMFSPQILIVTQGSRGGFFYDGAEHRYPAFPVTVVDSNGAGDVFHGAFLVAYLEGQAPMEAAIFASAVSALKCMRLGGRSSVPTREAAEAFLKERRGDNAV